MIKILKSERYYPLYEKHFLPVDWREERIIPVTEYNDFFGKTLQKLEPYLFEIDLVQSMKSFLIVNVETRTYKEPGFFQDDSLFNYLVTLARLFSQAGKPRKRRVFLF